MPYVVRVGSLGIPVGVGNVGRYVPVERSMVQPRRF